MTTRQRAEATNTKRATKTKTTAAADGVTVTWRGTAYRLPTADDFPLDAMEAEENGKTLTALRLILGDDQYATWRADARTAGDAEEFSTHIMRELGAGNR
jgi:hypothetical protein